MRDVARSDPATHPVIVCVPLLARIEHGGGLPRVPPVGGHPLR